MRSYLIKRILLFIPTLFVVSLVIFFISRNSRIDEISEVLELRGVNRENLDEDTYNEYYQQLVQDKGYDKPQFYAELKAKKVFGSDFVIPQFLWHGFDNQYHNWFGRILKGDLGLSFLDGQPSFSKIKSALVWTIVLIIPTILITFGIAYIAAIKLAQIPRRKAESILTALHFFYAIPLFWLATLAVMFFTTEDYGLWTNLFPSVGIRVGESNPWAQVADNLDKFILPVFITFLHYIGYITRILYRSIYNALKNPYILSSISMGSSPDDLVKQHAVPNARLSYLTLLIESIPNALAGALITEVIFNLPGMGRLMYDSLLVADWNVIFGIVGFLGFITIVFYLIGDLFYMYFSPHIRLG